MKTTTAPAAALPAIKLEAEDRPACGYCEAPNAAALIEVAAERNENEFVARCMNCMEYPAEADEPLFTQNGNPAFVLTLEQRNAIFSGDHTAIKLGPSEPKPDIEPGQVKVLAESKGGPQFLARSERERLKLVQRGLPLLAEVPSKPTVWIVYKQPQLKDGRWVVEFDAHDIRERVRTLAAAPAGTRQAGLKTRQKRRVSKRQPYREKAPSDADRGYGGGGHSTVDEREGVDDNTLDRYSRGVADESAARRKVKLLERRVSALERELVKAEEKDRARTVEVLHLELRANREEIAELREEHRL